MNINNYLRHIASILLNRETYCFYNEDEMLVYTCDESLQGNIHGVFGYSSGMLRNNTIYAAIFFRLLGKPSGPT